MKTLRIAATCAVALIMGQASADEDKTASQNAPSVEQDVGATPQMSVTASGSPTRDRVPALARNAHADNDDLSRGGMHGCGSGAVSRT